jgi:4-methyl-5(b-hydroxyethyl)-thiazole monophosphate biosynthesis
MKTVYAFLADGMEEVEALMVIDLLRRTKKINVVTVSIKEELMVESSHGIKLFADKNIEEIDFDSGDCIFLPGGIPGTPNLADCKELETQIIKYNDEGKWLTAICAAPSIYSELGLLKDKKATSYPTFADKMDCREYGGSVVTDGNFITAKGLGVALELGLEMITELVDKETSEQVAEAIQYN